MKTYAQNRLSERSTWIGLAQVFAGAGTAYALGADSDAALGVALASLGGLLQALVPDSPQRGYAKPLRGIDQEIPGIDSRRLKSKK